MTQGGRGAEGAPGRPAAGGAQPVHRQAEPGTCAALALSLCSWESPEGRWAPGMVGDTERQPSGKGNEASSGGSSQPGGRCCAPRSGFTRWGLGDWHNSQRRGVTLSRTASGFWKRLPSGAGGAAVGRSRVRPEGVSLEARPAPLQGPALRWLPQEPRLSGEVALRL